MLWNISYVCCQKRDQLDRATATLWKEYHSRYKHAVQLIRYNILAYKTIFVRTFRADSSTKMAALASDWLKILTSLTSTERILLNLTRSKYTTSSTYKYICSCVLRADSSIRMTALASDWLESFLFLKGGKLYWVVLGDLCLLFMTDEYEECMFLVTNQFNNNNSCGSILLKLDSQKIWIEVLFCATTYTQSRYCSVVVKLALYTQLRFHPFMITWIWEFPQFYHRLISL